MSGIGTRSLWRANSPNNAVFRPIDGRLEDVDTPALVAKIGDVAEELHSLLDLYSRACPKSTIAYELGDSDYKLGKLPDALERLIDLVEEEARPDQREENATR